LGKGGSNHNTVEGKVSKKKAQGGEFFWRIDGPLELAQEKGRQQKKGVTKARLATPKLKKNTVQ